MYTGLPSLAAYVESLPFGLESHPNCKVKASVYRDALESKPIDDVVDELPPVLRTLVREPPPVSSWVFEVQVNGIMIAVRDRHFKEGEPGLDEYEAWTRERNRRLLTRPLYRALFLLLSPERLFSGLGRRWSAFRRGTSLECFDVGRGHATLRLRYPTNLYDITALRGLSGAFGAAAEAAGAHEARFHLGTLTPREARWMAEWR